MGSRTPETGADPGASAPGSSSDPVAAGLSGRNEESGPESPSGGTAGSTPGSSAPGTETDPPEFHKTAVRRSRLRIAYLWTGLWVSPCRPAGSGPSAAKGGVYGSDPPPPRYRVRHGGGGRVPWQIPCHPPPPPPPPEGVAPDEIIPAGRLCGLLSIITLRSQLSISEILQSLLDVPSDLFYFQRHPRFESEFLFQRCCERQQKIR